MIKNILNENNIVVLNKKWTRPKGSVQNNSEILHRPGISKETLAVVGVREVSSLEAKTLIGFEAEGIAIPYMSPSGGKLMVKDREFHRIRRTNPGNGPKYLSPAESGAQVYWPLAVCGSIQSDVLVLTEGEFKALALAESGIPAAGLGGISSAMTGGKLLPDLAKLIETRKVKTVAFLGDTDSSLLYEFAREAVKLRKALPDAVRLVLPRVEFVGPKGIDDTKEKFGERFVEKWEGYMANAVEVSPKISSDQLAMSLLKPVLEDVCRDYAEHETKLFKFARQLGAVALDELARSVKTFTKTNIPSFKQGVANFRDEHELREGVSIDGYFYDGNKYMLEEGLRFIELDRIALREHLTKAGCREDELGSVCCTIRTEGIVDYMGPLPGFDRGLHEGVNGERLLVTSSPRIIEAQSGNPELILRIFRGLFADEAEPCQIDAVLGWIKVARANLMNKERRPLPAMAMIGPRNCGKTLAIEIMRLSLGGRAVPAYRALTNSNGFNGALLDAELLTVDDEVAGKDHRTRAQFGQAIKTTLFGATVGITKKYHELMTVKPIHALVIALNEEPENVMVLPPLDDSLLDKISLVHVGRAGLVGEEGADRIELMCRIEEEMPAFLWFLEQFEIPENLRENRTTIRAYQHPEVLRLLNVLAPEQGLAELLTTCARFRRYGTTDPESVVLTAKQVESALFDDENTKFQASRLLSWTAACGVYLGRLADQGRGVRRNGCLHGFERYEITKFERN